MRRWAEGANGGDVDERRGNTGNGVHGLTGEVGHPRGLDVLQDLRPKIVDLRQVEGETLIDEGPRLLIHIGKPRNQCDHLLDEHVAEQQQQYAYCDDHHGERQQRRDHAVPTVNHQSLHHRFDRECEEQRNEDVVDQVRDRSPRPPAVGEQNHGDGDVQQRSAEPFRWPPVIALRGEQGPQIPSQALPPTVFSLIAFIRAFVHGTPL